MSLELSMTYGESLVLYELLARYHRSRDRELVPDRAEWRALILLLGQLEKQLSTGQDPKAAQEALQKARKELAAYDGIPF